MAVQYPTPEEWAEATRKLKAQRDYWRGKADLAFEVVRAQGKYSMFDINKLSDAIARIQDARSRGGDDETDF